MPFAELVSPLIGLSLTLLIFSYLLGDNGVYRFLVNFLAGLSLTYATVVVISNVIVPQVFRPILQTFSAEPNYGLTVTAIVPFFFGALLLLKLSPRGWFPLMGNWGMALLIGVGAGVAVGGALVGSLLGLTNGAAAGPGLALASGHLEAVLASVIALVGTITVLAYFWYSSRPGGVGDQRPAPVRVLANIGRVFLMITFGALFGGALLAGIATLTDRLGLIMTIIGKLTTR